MSAIILALWFAHPGMNVSGDSTCPTPTEVRDQLVALAPDSDGDAAATPGAHQVNLSSVGSDVHIELLGEGGQLVAERTLARTGSCGDVAEAVAVIISAWEAKFNPNLATEVVRPPEPPPYEPVPDAAQEATATAGQPMSFDVGLAPLASITGGEMAYGLKLEGALFPTQPPLGWDVAPSASTTHTQSIAVPASAAQWTRAALSVGPTFRLGRNKAMLDIHAGGVLALLHVQGTGLSSPSSDTSAQAGMVAGLRLLWTWNNSVGWIGTDVFTYPGQDRLTIGNYGEVGRLPRLEVQIAIGIGAGQFP